MRKSPPTRALLRWLAAFAACLFDYLIARIVAPQYVFSIPCPEFHERPWFSALSCDDFFDTQVQKEY
jgi:hypothetical protein